MTPPAPTFRARSFARDDTVSPCLAHESLNPTYSRKEVRHRQRLSPLNQRRIIKEKLHEIYKSNKTYLPFLVALSLSNAKNKTSKNLSQKII